MGKKNTIVIDEKTPLLLLAGPMFLELFLNTMVNNIDTLMLSHYDEAAVGAVGNANTIMFMMNILFNVIATATSVVVAQYLGAKRYDKMNMIYTLAFAVNFVPSRTFRFQHIRLPAVPVQPLWPSSSSSTVRLWQARR